MHIKAPIGVLRICSKFIVLSFYTKLSNNYLYSGRKSVNSHKRSVFTASYYPVSQSITKYDICSTGNKYFNNTEYFHI